MKVVLSLIVGVITLFAITPKQIIKNINHNLQSTKGYYKITILTKNKNIKTKLILKSYNLDNDKSFIKIVYPLKNKGIIFLRLGSNMWQYIPKIDRVIKIPSSMLMGSFMGGGFSANDIIKDNFIFEDYNFKITNEDKLIYSIILTPKKSSTVVWGKIVLKISNLNFTPIKAIYYDQDNNKQKELSYYEVKKFGNRYFPTKWILKTASMPNNHTTIIFSEIDFNAKINIDMFSKRSLKRYSK